MTAALGDISTALFVARLFGALDGKWVATSGGPPPLLLRELLGDVRWITPEPARSLAGTIAAGCREVLSAPTIHARGAGLTVLAPGETLPAGISPSLIWSNFSASFHGYAPVDPMAPGVFLLRDLAGQAAVASPILREVFLDILSGAASAEAGMTGIQFCDVSTAWLAVEPMTCLDPGDPVDLRARMLRGSVETPCLLHLPKPDRGGMKFEIVLSGRGALPSAPGTEVERQGRQVCLVGTCPADGELIYPLRIDGAKWRVDAIRWRIDVPITTELPDFAHPLDHYGRDPFGASALV